MIPTCCLIFILLTYEFISHFAMTFFILQVDFTRALKNCIFSVAEKFYCSFQKLKHSRFIIGQYNLQTADCRLQTKYKMQNRNKLQTEIADLV